MTRRNISILAVLLFVGIGLFIYMKPQRSTPVNEVPVSPTVAPTTPPVFVWKYEPADTLNLDGFPKTNVFLTATYPNTTVVRTLVGTSDGSCNDLPDSTEPHAPDSTVAICYGAGFGSYYKVVLGDTSYRVMRKEFEEGSPEYNPPEQPFKMVAEFPVAH